MAKKSRKSDKRTRKKGKYGTGVVTIVRNRAKNAEDTEFYFEIKPTTSKYKENVGKSALLGGAKEQDEGDLETLTRELHEELSDSEAARIISKHAKYYKTATIKLKDGENYFRIMVYESVINDPKMWAKIKSSTPSGDGGYKRIAKVGQLGSSGYVYGYDRIVDRYAKDKLGVKTNISYQPLSGFYFN